MVLYTVKRGDSLYSIARRFGSDIELIAKDNGIESPYNLSIGEVLIVRQPITIYVAQNGDNIYSVAQRYMTTVNRLWRNNPYLAGKFTLSEGEKIIIGGDKPINEKEISVNAYVYPSIDREVLRKTLPYLTYLTVFSYGLEEDGNLIDIDDEEIIELARQYGAAPIMLVSTLGEDGNFSNELAINILSNSELQNILINNIVEKVAEKRYSGVDMDFEYIPSEYAEEYVLFLKKLNDRLDESGAILMAALAPKISGDQPGLLYEGHDYEKIGNTVDKALLMTYEWGYAYGPPMAVAPINKVREVVDYAVGVIEPSKILLGMPNYGYDWQLPYVRGKSRAKSLGNIQAIDLSKEKRAAILFDEEARSPYFIYYDKENGKPQEHVVWYENAESIQNKLNLVAEYGLDGIGVWNAMRYFPQLWLVLDGTFNIRKVLR